MLGAKVIGAKVVGAIVELRVKVMYSDDGSKVVICGVVISVVDNS